MVVEVVYSNLANNQASKDPDDIQCLWFVWQKFVQSLWMLYTGTLAIMDLADIEAPTVYRPACELQHFKETFQLWKHCPTRSVESHVGHCGSLLGKHTLVSCGRWGCSSRS